jgi:transposase
MVRLMFDQFIAQFLMPKLGQRQLIIWDNRSVDESIDADELNAVVVRRVVPSPPYSPELIPIEQLFSKPKVHCGGPTIPVSKGSGRRSGWDSI